jgi:Gamma-glutamyl cyclotransferase, AIG2-like
LDEWYFAYGSNLWVDQMIRRIGPIRQGDDWPRFVQLPGYRLAFNMQGDCGRVFANIVQPGEAVLGVVYRCGPAALDILDRYESGYERQRVTVVDDRSEEIEAVA